MSFSALSPLKWTPTRESSLDLRSPFYNITIYIKQQSGLCSHILIEWNVDWRGMDVIDLPGLHSREAFRVRAPPSLTQATYLSWLK